MTDTASSSKRSVSDGSFFKKLKLGRLMHSRSKKKDNDDSDSPRRKKSRKYQSVDALIRPSLSLRRSGKGKHEIAKRRISGEFPGNDQQFSFSQSKRTSQFDLPDIVSIKSSRTKRSHNQNEIENGDENQDNITNDGRNSSGSSSGEERDLDFSFRPRRSLHNSTAGMKRINTAHGYFNIPITIDSHNDRTSENLLRSRKTDNSLLDYQNTKAKSDNRLDLEQPHFNESGAENTSSGILGTLLSFAHSAVNHVPRISIEEPHDIANNHQMATRNGSLNELRNISDNMTPNPVQTGTRGNSKEPSPTDDNGANDTVVHNPANRPSKNINRSTSFLKHLDYLLSASNGNDKNTADLATNTDENTNTTNSGPIGTTHLKPGINPNQEAVTPASTQSKFSVNTEEISERNHELNPNLMNRVKFEPIKAAQPAISSLGKGNLTLDAFASTANLDDNTNTHLNTIVGSPNNTLPIDIASQNNDNTNLQPTGHNVKFRKSDTSMDDMEMNNAAPIAFHGIDDTRNPSKMRNSSYVNLTKEESLEDMLKKSRARSKTLPAHEVVLSNEAQKANEEKRNSRYSSVSNDEAMANTANPRKSRALSRNFLNRRSFSPNINMKVPIPGISLRNSINKYRTSNEVLDQPRPRTSTNLSGSLTPVMGINYENYRELEGIDYANEKRNAEFHSLFNDSGLNPNEKLIIDHSCALSRDILLQGRMYISDQHLCFYSNILGWVSTVIIPFNEIVQIEKKTTAGIFPNGIVIDTLHTKYIFASFIARDATFDLITDVWNQIILGRRHLRNDDDDFDSELLSNYSSNDNLSHGSAFYDDDNDSDLRDTDMTSSDDIDDDIFADISGPKQHKQTNDSKYGPSKHPPTSANYTPAANEKLVSETVIKGPLGKVATLLFGDDVGPYERILKAQKNFELSTIPPLITSKERDYSYTKPLNAGFGPSKTRCLINDKVVHFNFDDYVQVIQSSKTPDVPSGNAFVVKNNTILTWDTNNSTKVTVYFSTEWTSKSWLKGAIEKGAYDGVVETTRVMNLELEKMIQSDLLDSIVKDKGHETSKEIEEVEVSTLPTAGPATHAPTEPDYKKEKSDVVVEDCLNIPAPLGTVFELLYGNDTSYFLSILEKQNTMNISEIPQFVNNEREFTYIKKLNNSIGPKQTKCQVSEKIGHKDLNAYTMTTQIVRSPDVPYGNSFSVHTRTFLSWGPSNTTNMKVVTNVVWTGKSLLKGTIEKGSIDGQRSGTNTVISELRDMIANAGSTKKKSRKRSKTTRASTRTISEKKPETKAEPQSTYDTETPGMFSFIENLDITSISGLSIIFVVLLFLIFFFRFLFSKGDTPRVALIKPGRILIDGNEYNYAPNIKTLYEVYEDDILRKHGNRYKRSDYTTNVIAESETTIWDWLEDRSNPKYEDIMDHSLDTEPIDYSLEKDTTQLSSSKTPKSKINPKKLKESIKVTELQLQKMKDLLNDSNLISN